MDNMREEFEAWFSNEFKYKPLSCDGGNYTTVSARAAWSGWKASRALLCVELPENCKGMALTVDEFHKQLDKVGVSYK